MIATHSPIVLAYPNADIFQLSTDGIEAVAYEDSEPFIVTQRFLSHRHSVIDELIRD